MARFEILDSNMAPLGEGPASGDMLFELGMMYSVGRDVPVDLVSAHKWFNLAAVKGNAEAIRLRREIANQMSDAEIAVAQRAARDWLRNNAGRCRRGARDAATPAPRDMEQRDRIQPGSALFGSCSTACGRRTGTSWRRSPALASRRRASDRDQASPRLSGNRAANCCWVAGSSTKPVNCRPFSHQERFDLRQRHLMFLDVEDQVAAFVGGEEIAERARRLQQRTVLRRQNLLATAPDVFRDRPVAALGDQRARGDDVLPRQFAVEADLHHAAGPQ